MVTKAQGLLTNAQRNDLLSIKKLGNEEFKSYFSFSAEDIELINKHRGEANRMGFGIQLCLARYPGIALSDSLDIPEDLLKDVGAQLGISIIEFENYGKGKNTLLNHLTEICTYYNYQECTWSNLSYLKKILEDTVKENFDELYLIQSAVQEFRKHRILLPDLIEIERIVISVRTANELELYQKISDILSDTQKEKLEQLLVIGLESKRSKLAWLKTLSGKSTKEAALDVCYRIKTITAIKLNQEALSFVHENRLGQLARVAERYKTYDYIRFDENKRYALLTTFLIKYQQVLIDHLINIHTRILMTIKRSGQNAAKELHRSTGEQANELLKHYAEVIEIIESSRNTGEDLFLKLDQMLTWENLLIEAEQAKQLVKPKRFSYMDLIKKKAVYLRGYVPTMIETLELKSNKQNDALINALNHLIVMKEENKRKISADISLDFVKKKWKPLVLDNEGQIDRSFFELTAATELTECLRSGEIFETNSIMYRDLNDYLVDKTSMHGSLTIPNTFEEYITTRSAVLDEKLRTYSKLTQSFDRISITKHDKNTPEEADFYKRELYKLLPGIDLADLLIEVNSWTGFMNEFVHEGTGKIPDENELEVLFATLLAMGLNINLGRMARTTPNISFPQMANAKQWRMSPEAFRRAQSILVNAQIGTPLSKIWGDGTRSSSDGLRIQVGVSSVHADINPHYGTERGATIYRHTADKYVSHFVEIIATNQREAASAIDGAIGHNTELELEEHFTDSNAYTDTAFAIFHLLGFKFQPRIRDIGSMQLFSIKPISEYKKVQSLLTRTVRTKDIQEYYGEIKQIVYSIQTGKTTAKVILNRLGSYARKNKVVQALNELGKIEKTIFLLEYAIDEDLRRKITRMLNRGELINDLARELFSGQHGKFMERDIEKQLQSASALNIIINAISLWNTVYLQKAYDHYVKEQPKIEKYMTYTSPIIWNHINLLGEYKIDLLSKPNKLRSLNTENYLD
ncbi:Tn3 family transposase [Enterococcus faecalis]|uniref:Tn3 family transposase n=1 Tax=Enterococcus faecalis TaxID=1351 RepID=UPI0040413ED1